VNFVDRINGMNRPLRALRDTKRDRGARQLSPSWPFVDFVFLASHLLGGVCAIFNL